MRNKNVISFVLIFFLCFRMCLSYYGKAKSWNEKYERNICPRLYPKNFVNYTPVGNFTAGNFTEKSELKGLRQCMMECCMSPSCNVALLVKELCYHIECVSNELCLPLQRSTERKMVSMILVKPVLPNENWLDILDSTNKEVNTNDMPEDEVIYSPYQSQQQLPTNEEEENFLSKFLTNLPNMEDESTRNYLKYTDNDADLVDASLFMEKVSCLVGADDCPIDSECIPISLDTRRGICKCVLGTEQNDRGACVPTIRPFAKGPTNIDLMLKNSDDKSDALKFNLNAPVSIVNLKVSVLSKEVQLPENEVTLVAYTVPDENATNSHYNYVWTLADQPKEGFTGNMKQNGPTVTLSELTEGQYRFKVTVNGTNSYGEGFANVTVLPPHRVNKPPQVAIMPTMQTVKLPNTKAVLDGSGSTDDDQIISYHWELISGPIGYQPPLQDGPTLELQDLKQAGNYTFKLTVEDSDHAINSTTANITVLNHTDYPPEANAGQNVIIYLPNNSLTLNGSLSTDDHEIVSWEWTKAAEDEDKAVDMQNTHSPYLQLSNLSEGVYRFVLKVTDSSGQSSTADVRVFVKPPTNTPPLADAGSDMFISLPQTWAVLNGSASHDDHRIVAWTWYSAFGPTNATILNFNHSIANATGLTKGVYVFTLKVVDDNGNVAMDNVTVTVTQNKNSPPKADGGGDQVLTLPVPVLILNGSKSSDDFRIVSWRWSRVPSGLAAGTIVLNSDTQPVLMLTNIEAGRYVFELTVTDDQGESSRDTVSVQVKPNPLENSLIELTLNVPIDTFTQSQLDSLLQKISLLVKEDVRVNVTALRGVVDTGNTQIIFFLSKGGTALGGLEALATLDPSLWAAWSGRARTVRCLSSCSGRGSCSQATRTCRCDPLWMQSLWPSDPMQPDCAWSVVYFGVGALGVFAVLYVLLSAVCRGCRRKRAAAPPAYKLLPTGDSQTLQLTSKNLSETDTDSDDVLFETKTKTSSFTRQPNGQSAKSNKKNGYKRRVRT